MHKTRPTYGSKKVTRLILYGSISVCLVLTLLLVLYDVTVIGMFRLRTLIGLSVLLFLVFGIILIRKNKTQTVNWMLLGLYTGLAFSTVLFWGLNAAAGIFATSFVIILAGILLGSRAILPITITVALMLCAVQIIHMSGLVVPDISKLSDDASFLDVITYITIIGIFSLITWISNTQIEKSMSRARQAEKTLRSQKDMLAIELEKESARLRQVQLKEMEQLYRFATLGQNAAATLHDLSNHLSVLNMDIDDLKQQNQNSQAIKNAEEGIEQINLMVRQIRRKLNNYDDSKSFQVGTIIKRVIKDNHEKFQLKQVALQYSSNNLGRTHLVGDTFALTQILTVLINNALDACYELPNAKVIVRLRLEKKHLQISVIDNGIGISESAKNNLFLPTLSSKPNGLGVGLYIAKQLAESHFNGTIYLRSTNASQSGAQFVVEIPIKQTPPQKSKAQS